MKQIQEFCTVCESIQPHRQKRMSIATKRKDVQYSTFFLPIKCMTCGNKTGRDNRKEKKGGFMSLRS